MLLSNPLANPYLPTLSTTLAAVFGSSLAALFLAARGSFTRLVRGTLFRRWRTWLVIAPLYSLAVLSGPLGAALLATILAGQAAREYAALTHLAPLDGVVLLTLASAGPVLVLAFGARPLVFGAMGLPLLASAPALLAQDIHSGVRRAALLAFGLAYVGIPLSLLVLIGAHPSGGPGLLLGLGLAVALSDVCAFTCGSSFGRRRLAPVLSPAKTWAGACGNVLGAALGLWLLAPLLPPRLPTLALAPLIALGAVWGDLLESLLKRAAHVKDAGAWLPGFGGLLDRVDSLLVVLPLVYLCLEISR